MKVEYDDTKLRRFYAELPMVQRANAVRAAERRLTNQARKAAKQKLIATGMKNADKVAKGIRGIVYRDVIGFRLTVGTSGRKSGANGFYTNRYGKTKPVLLWFEDGTAERNSRIHRGRGSGFKGSIAPVKFMAKTKDEMTPKVTEAFHEALRQSVMRIAKKNGAK